MGKGAQNLNPYLSVREAHRRRRTRKRRSRRSGAAFRSPTDPERARAGKPAWEPADVLLLPRRHSAPCVPPPQGAPVARSAVAPHAPPSPALSLRTIALPQLDAALRASSAGQPGGQACPLLSIPNSSSEDSPKRWGSEIEHFAISPDGQAAAAGALLSAVGELRASVIELKAAFGFARTEGARQGGETRVRTLTRSALARTGQRLQRFCNGLIILQPKVLLLRQSANAFQGLL